MDDAKKISFQSFKAKFRKSVTSRTFGEPPRSHLNKESAASKELRRIELLDVLKGDEFCKKMYDLSQECWRLETERKKVLEVARRMRPAIHRYRSATRRLESCARKLAEFGEMYRGFIDQTTSQKIRSAVALIDIVAGELDRRRGVLVSNLHSKHRRDKNEPSKWELLFKFYNYNLKKVGVKATDLWFWTSMNGALLEFSEDYKSGSLSAMTRFKLIAAISEAAGHSQGEPSAIKQFFAGNPSRQQKSL
jgi:hypothetical protein